MTDEEFAYRLAYTCLTTNELWRSQILSFYKLDHDRRYSVYKLRETVYVTDAKLLLEAGTSAHFGDDPYTNEERQIYAYVD